MSCRFKMRIGTSFSWPWTTLPQGSGELRIELGLEHEIIETILKRPGDRSGVVVIDALDAARGEPSSAALLTLIRAIVEAKSRWHVVASIRKYDLRYNPELRELFRGDLVSEINPELRDVNFPNLRHVNVPLFNDQELAAIRHQAPAFDRLLESAPPALRDLLHVPLNIQLMTDILDSGIDVAEL